MWIEIRVFLERFDGDRGGRMARDNRRQRGDSGGRGKLEGGGKAKMTSSTGSLASLCCPFRGEKKSKKDHTCCLNCC